MKIPKFVGTLVRRRLYTVSGIAEAVAEVYKPPTIESKLVNKLKEKYLSSDLPRKIRVAKGFYTLEMAPPTSMNELEQIKGDVMLAIQFLKSKGYNHMTVRQLWLLILVCVEVSMWFWLGEVIGKMHIVGYKV